jgi:hypothetical protein
VVALVGAALVLALSVPTFAFAASVEASPVVTVAGSETSVSGTVTLSPVSIAALSQAIASRDATVTLGPVWDSSREAVLFMGTVALCLLTIDVTRTAVRG